MASAKKRGKEAVCAPAIRVTGLPPPAILVRPEMETESMRGSPPDPLLRTPGGGGPGPRRRVAPAWSCQCGSS